MAFGCDDDLWRKSRLQKNESEERRGENATVAFWGCRLLDWSFGSIMGLDGLKMFPFCCRAPGKVYLPNVLGNGELNQRLNGTRKRFQL